ncbi:MAG: hypothetical protein HYX47_04295 [Burkholderiales bacterium]|nr:hypothetical protein [Burkholderiales bacterium]
MPQFTSHQLEQLVILATGSGASAATLAALGSVPDGALTGVVDRFLSSVAAGTGATKTFQQVVRNGLGVALSDAQAASLVSELAKAGVDSWGKIVQLLIDKQGGVFDVLDARADAGLAFNSALAASGKSAFFDRAAVAAAVGGLLQTIGTSASSAAAANDGLTALAGRLTKAGIMGSVVDGYVAGATVFADANGNHQLDAGEWSTRTDASGNFVLSGDVTGTLVASGGTDLQTGKAFGGMLTALPGGSLLNPVTTMIEAMVSSGGAATVEQAIAKVAVALNLPSGVNPLTYDPLAVLANGQASASAKAAALAYQQTNEKIVAIVGSFTPAEAILTLAKTLSTSTSAVDLGALATAAATATATAIATENAYISELAIVAAYNSTKPTLTISSSRDVLHAGETSTITFTFTKDPGNSFVDGDISVTGGTLTALSGTGAVRTATFTASAVTQLNAGAHIKVDPSSFQDASGNLGASNGDPALHIGTAFTPVLFVGNSATFGRVDPVLTYDTYNATTNPGGVHDLTSSDRGGTFTNLNGSNLYEPHNWGGVPGLVDRFADQVGLTWDVSISARNAATLSGQYRNSSPAGWDLRGNIASAKWDIVVLQDQTDEPLPGGTGSITFAAGSATASLIVTPRSDTSVENDETLALTLATGTGYRVGTSSAVSTSILNDDPTAPANNPALPTVTLATSGSVLEDGHTNLVFTFTRTGSTAGALTVSFTPTRDGSQPSVASPLAATGDVELYSSTTFNPVAVGTSGSSARFSAGATGFALDTNTGANTTTGSISFNNPSTIVIPAGQASASVTYDPRADAVVEVDESIRFTLGTSANYNVGTQGAVTGTILNDDFAAGTDTSLPNITLGLASAAGVYESAGQNLVYTFTRSGSTSGALTVNFTESGTATYFSSSPTQSDFSLSTTGATGSSLVTTGGANADTASLTTYANLIANYIHTGAADSTTIAGTTIAANANASTQTDIYLYSTWARPDMIVGNFDMVTSKVVQPDGSNGGTGAITQTTTQGAGYYLRLEDMSTDLTNAYNALATANSQFKGVAAVSTAFMNAVVQGLSIRDPYTETAGAGKINLWFDDNLHASKYGSYLAGLTLFQTLTGLDSQVLGASDVVARNLGVDSTTAVALQKVASATAGFDASLRWTSPGRVADLGGTNAAVTLATAGAYSFVDPAVTQHTVSVQARAGALGTLTAAVRSDGNMGEVNWLYKVGNQVIDPLLGGGVQRTDTFDVLLSDGAGHSLTNTVVVTLVGTTA